MYHGVIDTPMAIPDSCMIDVQKFERQLRYIKKHFRVLSLSEALNLISEGDFEEPSVVITFDDGYQNNHDLALPLLERYELPATIYLATRFLDSDTTIWTGLLHNAFSSTNRSKFVWRETEFDLSSCYARFESMRQVKSLLKDNSQESLFEEVDEIVLSLSNGSTIELPPNSPFRMLNSLSIQSLASSELIELGAHTHNHYVLSRVSPETQRDEIQTSVRLVNSLSGQSCRSFAYPNGRRCDYNKDTLAILESEGIDSAVTTEPSTCDALTPPLELYRIPVDGGADFGSFRLSLFNIVGLIKSALRQGEAQ